MAATAAIKGEKLEQLAKYLFEKIRGLEFYDKNILDANRAHELDVAFWNSQEKTGLSFLDAVLIVECKNTGTPVDSNAVGWFVRKLQDRSASHGILVALNGITGSGGTAAYAEVESALVRDKIKILVLTRDEIQTLGTTNDLVRILREKVLKLVLYKTVA